MMIATKQLIVDILMINLSFSKIKHGHKHNYIIPVPVGRAIDVCLNTMWCEFAQPDGLTDQHSNPWSCVYTTRKLFHMVVWVG